MNKQNGNSTSDILSCNDFKLHGFFHAFLILFFLKKMRSLIIRFCLQI